MPLQSAPGNDLLLRLPSSDRKRLLDLCDLVPLEFGQLLVEANSTARNAYFPTTALISVVMPVEGQFAAEVGMVGREGFLGLGLAFSERASGSEALVQGKGAALRIRAGPFLREYRASATLRRQVNRFADEFMEQIARCAACNLFHSVEERLARWLLMKRDRNVMSAEFEVTHQFLANLLGARREGVTLAANRLQEGGLIEYGRGYLSIVNSAGLEAAACACYAKLRIS